MFFFQIYQSLGSEVTPWSRGGLVAMQIPTQICFETKNTNHVDFWHGTVSIQ